MPEAHLPKVVFARKLRRDMSNAERKLWAALRGHRFHGLQFRRQTPCGPYVADFLCHAARLVIEVDGATHATEAELARDRERDAWFEDNGFSVLRVTNAEVYAEFEGVLETIRLRAEERDCPHPNPPPLCGRGSSIRAPTTSRVTSVVRVCSSPKRGGQGGGSQKERS